MQKKKTGRNGLLLILLITAFILLTSCFGWNMEQKNVVSLNGRQEKESVLDNSNIMVLSATDPLAEEDPATEDAYTEVPSDESIEVNVQAVNIRSGPGTDYKILGLAVPDHSFHQIATTSNGWSKIEYNDGFAYIRTKLTQITKTSNNESEKTAVETTAQPEENESILQQTDANMESTMIPAGSIYCTGASREIFEETNIRRAAAGQLLLEWSDDLAVAAGIRTGECAVLFSHTRPDGSDWYTVSSLVGGENLMRGPVCSAQTVVGAWMRSPTHKENVLYPDFQKIGIGIYYDERGMIACQSFGY